MHLDRQEQELAQNTDQVNVLGQQHIPTIVFFSYLLSLLVTTERRDQDQADCENEVKTRKVHYNFLDRHFVKNRPFFVDP